MNPLLHFAAWTALILQPADLKHLLALPADPDDQCLFERNRPKKKNRATDFICGSAFEHCMELSGYLGFRGAGRGGKNADGSELLLLLLPSIV